MFTRIGFYTGSNWGFGCGLGFFKLPSARRLLKCGVDVSFVLVQRAWEMHLLSEKEDACICDT